MQMERRRRELLRVPGRSSSRALMSYFKTARSPSFDPSDDLKAEYILILKTTVLSAAWWQITDFRRRHSFALPGATLIALDLSTTRFSTRRTHHKMRRSLAMDSLYLSFALLDFRQVHPTLPKRRATKEKYCAGSIA